MFSVVGELTPNLVEIVPVLCTYDNDSFQKLSKSNVESLDDRDQVTGDHK